MGSISQTQVEDLIRNTKNKFLNEDSQKSLYDAYNGTSQMLLTYRQHGGAANWSKNLIDQSGAPIYTNEEQQQLETSFKGLSPFLDPILLGSEREGQIGGQTDGYLKPGVSSKDLIQYDNPYGTINPDDISIDRAYKKVSNYIEELDEKNRILAKTLGPFRLINEMKVDPRIPLPPPLPPLQIPARSIVPGVMIFLELLRLMVTFGPFRSDFLRKINSLVLAMADLANGSWKNAILTGVGVFGSTPMLLGIMGKLVNNTFELMSPQVKVSLSNEAFKGVKSAFIGFWLYMFSVLAPDAVRTIVNTSLEGLAKPLEEFNKKIGNLEDKLQSQLGPSGLQVHFQQLPLTMLPSLDDIQNIQVLAQRPEIYCSPEFQQVLDPLMKLVPIRLALELMNVPTQDDDKAEACAGVDTSGISAAVAKQLEPEITLAPAAGSGPLNRVTQKVGGTRRRKQKTKSRAAAATRRSSSRSRRR
jgi:hypothetical protein